MLTNEVRESYAFGIYEMTKSLGHRKSVDLATISDEDLIKEHAVASQAVVDSIDRDKVEARTAVAAFDAKLTEEAERTGLSKADVLRKLLAADVMYRDLGFFCYDNELPYDFEPKLKEMLGE